VALGLVNHPSTSLIILKYAIVVNKLMNKLCTINFVDPRTISESSITIDYYYYKWQPHSW